MKNYELGLYEKAIPSSFNWEEKLNCAKECGFDFIEISIDESDDKLARLDWYNEEKEEIKKAMDEVKIPIRSMCLSGHRKYPMGSNDSVIRKKSMDIMEKAINLSDYLGIRTIMIAGYDVYYETSSENTKAFFIENLKKAVWMAACKGILLGFETMETDFLNTVAKGMYYIKIIESPYLGMYPDSGNITNAAKEYNTSAIDDLESGKGHIIALHLKETMPGKFREIPFFTGHVDFEKIIQKAWQLGVRRYVTEMWDVGNSTWKNDIKFACKNMKDILDSQKAI